MASAEAALPAFIDDVWGEYGSRISVDGGSEILVSDSVVANAVYKAAEGVRNPYGPKIVIAKRGRSGEEDSDIQDIKNGSYEPADNLRWEHYTHAIFGVSTEDPKTLLEAIKRMITAMQPKAVAIVIAVKQESKQAEGDDYTLSLEDKMTYQSKGKIQTLTDVLEFAGFEKGKIRSFQKSTKVDGEEFEAEVILARKWDQLSG